MTGIATGFSMSVRHENLSAQDALQEMQFDADTARALNYTAYRIAQRDPEERWINNGEWRLVPDSNDRIRVRMRAENSKVDLNRAPRELLEGLIGAVLPDAPAGELVDALIVWREGDERRVLDAAEQRERRAAGYRHLSANNAFQSVHQLGQVDGFDAQRAARLKPYLTVHGLSPRINALGADSVTLAAIPGLDALDAARFVEMRTEALANGRPVALDLLGEGRGFVEIRLDSKVISIDIEVSSQDGGNREEQFVIRLHPDHHYEILARSSPVPRSEQAL
ncbi:MAG: general secretion pathway protein GspK [Gammaproteobacteria bacterium]|nr:general secretion pathway protein GspK [Gammaproteobacteria bacterium]